MDKGITNILIVLIVGVSLLLGGYYLGKQSNNSPSLVGLTQTTLTTKDSSSSSQKAAEQEIKPSVAASPSPVVTSAPKPSSNAVPYQLITGAQVNTYKNNVYDFSFNLPKSLFFFNSETTVSRASFLEKQGDINAIRFGFEVVKTNAKLEDLAKQRELDKRYDQSFSLEIGTINGHEALFVSGQKSMKELCNFNSDEKRRIVLAALVRNKDYVLELTTNNTCDTFQTNWFDVITSSVSFY